MTQPAKEVVEETEPENAPGPMIAEEPEYDDMPDLVQPGSASASGASGGSGASGASGGSGASGASGASGGSGASGASGGSETAPLLAPEPEPDQARKPMTRQELEGVVGLLRWRKVRVYLVLLFWVIWMLMLAACVAVIVLSPRPGVTPLKWWQKSVFYRLQPSLFMKGQAGSSQGINAMCEQLPYLKSLGVGALILEGLFDDESALNVNGTELIGAFPQIKHLLASSNKLGLKMVLDLCELNLLGPHDVSRNAATVQHALWFWLEQGVAGFVICDTDDVYSEKTLLEWREVLNAFSRKDEERIIVVKQTSDSLPPLNTALVDLVMRSILPPSRHHLSALETVAAVKRRLQAREENIWQSWTIGGKTSRSLRKLLLVLMMTMPGSPVVQYDDAVLQVQNASQVNSSHVEGELSSTRRDNHWPNLTTALFSSLSHIRAREQALLYGSLTFLPYTTSTNSTFSSDHILAFMRSWGCVHFLVLLNVGVEFLTLDPAWSQDLPEEGEFVSSTGMDRMGPTSLHRLALQPHEAVVLKF